MVTKLHALFAKSSIRLQFRPIVHDPRPRKSGSFHPRPTPSIYVHMWVTKATLLCVNVDERDGMESMDLPAPVR